MLTDRQGKILDWLQTHPSAAIEEIRAQFAISTATAYRDARALVQTGLALKTSGGVRLAPPPDSPPSDGKCLFCGAPVNERAPFVFQLQDGSQRRACCPHCGLMSLNHPKIVTALASDFLYGRMVNARQATFLFGSSVHLCCAPSVLCFASEGDARRFQTGFGGQVFSLEQAVAELHQVMALPGTNGMAPPQGE
jgi:DeoR family transcriptional regulator, copper-sensing transcriptional repressor